MAYCLQNMANKPTTVDAYLASLPEDRRSAIGAVRKVILKSLDAGYEEGISYGMISYCVPHSRYPAGYHCDPKQPLPFAILGSQKNYMSLHLMCLYSGGDPDGPAAKLQEWFQTEFAKAGKKLDMGKACINFRKADDLALDAIAKLFEKVPASKWIATNEKYLESRKSPKRKASSKTARAGK
jgi:Domain of unknown function (DU1801)